MDFEQLKTELAEVIKGVSFEQLVNKLVDFATTSGFKLLAVIILVIVGLKAIKWLKKWIRTSPKLDKVDSSLRSFAVSFLSVVLYAILFVTVLMILGVPATSFVAVLTTCAAAIGLALQGSLSNFAGGIMILLFKPFKVGDYIEAAGESGVVSEISVVYTELLTLDNKRITIPNGTLTNSVIENYSSEELRRVDLNFSAAYNCDMKKVKEVIGSDRHYVLDNSKTGLFWIQGCSDGIGTESENTMAEYTSMFMNCKDLTSVSFSKISLTKLSKLTSVASSLIVLTSSFPTLFNSTLG